MISPSSFPGGTSVTDLAVYTDAAPDGICGGTPHTHLASTEAYVVTGGTGELQTIDAAGFRRTPLAAGAVVWFTPGTIHRAVNHGGLAVVVIMSNAGLPEAGDAVMTFPTDVLADHARYAEAARIPPDADESELGAAASRRRDLAVAGFTALRERMDAGDASALTEFHRAAARIASARASGWSDIVRARPLSSAERALDAARAVAAGESAHLADAAVHVAEPGAGPRAFGMCGRLRTYDVAD
ncbi:cupin domain-containing protein [Microbacterium thalli]|uniref:Cupin domain-containing protein n=1 Tax=Microbacterium thalli TaxID=3027921 RepID=A0ABT5SHH5_9MICO|nr:cupin domain-containing protein [Microbacterium thalli]MDD7961338.1 cupin domain-containing protein [Microbacterium thalli]